MRILATALSQAVCVVPTSLGSVLTSGFQALRQAAFTGVWTHLTCVIASSSCPSASYRARGGGHGGTRKSNTSRTLQTGAGNPAAIAGVQGRHRLAEPVPLVRAGWRRGIRQLAWGRQKLW